MSFPPNAHCPGERHYGLDWLRIGAFLTLIFYHIGNYFAPGSWVVKAPQTIDAVGWAMAAVQPWRMPLLFAVSGFASYALLRKSLGIGEFTLARTYRLAPPLLFGMAALVPPQAWIALVEGADYQHSFLHFWTFDWFSFHNRSGVALPNEGHLWFIAYLWTYTMLLAAALALAPVRWHDRAAAMVEAMSRGSRLLWVPLLPIVVSRLAVVFTIPETHGFIHDWVSDVLYVPAFLFGFALAATPSLWPAVLRARQAALMMAIASGGAVIAIEIWYPGDPSHLIAAVEREAQVIMAWNMILLLMGAAHQWLNRDHPLRRTLTEAIFPFYLVHQTVIVVVGWWIQDAAYGAATMFLILAASTIASCWVFYEIARRSGPLRPLFGLSRPKRHPETHAAGVRVGHAQS
jgi:hypothetical protein